MPDRDDARARFLARAEAGGPPPHGILCAGPLEPARPYRLAIVGSRDFADRAAVRAFVQGVHAQDPDVEIVSGGARGVDLEAELEARRLGMTVKVFPAQWRGSDGRGDYNARAGFERNQTIVNYADEIVAFWDGISRGTQDAIRRAEAARKPFAVRR